MLHVWQLRAPVRNRTGPSYSSGKRLHQLSFRGRGRGLIFTQTSSVAFFVVQLFCCHPLPSQSRAFRSGIWTRTRTIYFQRVAFFQLNYSRIFRWWASKELNFNRSRRTPDLQSGLRPRQSAYPLYDLDTTKFKSRWIFFFRRLRGFFGLVI